MLPKIVIITSRLFIAQEHRSDWFTNRSIYNESHRVITDRTAHLSSRIVKTWPIILMSLEKIRNHTQIRITKTVSKIQYSLSDSHREMRRGLHRIVRDLWRGFSYGSLKFEKREFCEDESRSTDRRSPLFVLSYYMRENRAKARKSYSIRHIDSSKSSMHLTHLTQKREFVLIESIYSIWQVCVAHSLHLGKTCVHEGTTLMDYSCPLVKLKRGKTEQCLRMCSKAERSPIRAITRCGWYSIKSQYDTWEIHTNDTYMLERSVDVFHKQSLEMYIEN